MHVHVFQKKKSFSWALLDGPDKSCGILLAFRADIYSMRLRTGFVRLVQPRRASDEFPLSFFLLSLISKRLFISIFFLCGYLFPPKE